MIRYGAFLRIEVPVKTEKKEFKYCKECYPIQPPSYSTGGKYCQTHGCMLTVNLSDVTFSDTDLVLTVMRLWNSPVLSYLYRYENDKKCLYVYSKNDDSSSNVNFMSACTNIDKDKARELLKEEVSTFIVQVCDNFYVDFVFGVVGDNNNDDAEYDR